RREFESLHPELRIRLLRLALDTAGDGRNPYALQQVEDLAGRFNGREAFSRTTLGGAVVDRDDEAIVIYREVGRMADAEMTVAPGETVLWDERFAIENRGDDSVVVIGGGLLTREVAEELLPQVRFQMA